MSNSKEKPRITYFIVRIFTFATLTAMQIPQPLEYKFIHVNNFRVLNVNLRYLLPSSNTCKYWACLELVDIVVENLSVVRSSRCYNINTIISSTNNATMHKESIRYWSFSGQPCSNQSMLLSLFFFYTA